MAGLFGETSHGVRQAMMNEQLNQASIIGSLGPGGHGALAGGLLGKGIGELFGGQDPRLQKAQAMQQIEQEISQMGLEPGTPEFTRQVVGRIRTRVGEQEAIQAWQMASQLEGQRAEVESIRNGPAAEQAQIERRIRFLGTLGLPADIALNDKLFEKVVGDVLTEKDPEKIRTLRELQGDPSLMKTAKELAQAGAGRTSVEVNSFDVPTGFMRTEEGVVPIPGGPKDPGTLSPGEAQAARDKATTIDGGITAVDALINTLEGSGPPIAPGQEKSIANFLRGEMLSAVAAMRNMGVLQPGELEFLKSQIPEVSGFVAAIKQGIDPQALTAPLRVFRQRAMEARGRLRLPEQEKKGSGKSVRDMTDAELEELAK